MVRVYLSREHPLAGGFIEISYILIAQIPTSIMGIRVKPF